MKIASAIKIRPRVSVRKACRVGVSDGCFPVGLLTFTFYAFQESGQNSCLASASGAHRETGIEVRHIARDATLARSYVIHATRRLGARRIFWNF